MKSFYELYGDKPLSEIFAEWWMTPVSVEPESWAHFPPAEFIRWAQAFPRNPHDGIPPAEHHKEPPSFLLSQTHRVWLSAKLVADYSELDGHLVDFGSFPFVVPITLRDYFAYRGAITVTAIQPVVDEMRPTLEKYQLQVDSLDLDPYVRDPARSVLPPPKLAIEPDAVDVVTMFHVIEHLYHPMDALREAYRILRPGGRLIIGTDNAMMLNTLLNYVSGYGYTFEPVNSTSAMTVHDWRGHVRFFTAQDLQTMAEAAGFELTQIGFEQVFYDVFHEAYFTDPTPYIASWQVPILKENRQFANDVYLIATKPNS